MFHGPTWDTLKKNLKFFIFTLKQEFQNYFYLHLKKNSLKTSFLFLSRKSLE